MKRITRTLKIATVYAKVYRFDRDCIEDKNFDICCEISGVSHESMIKAIENDKTIKVISIIDVTYFNCKYSMSLDNFIRYGTLESGDRI